MTLVLELPLDVEARLQAVAAAQGMEPAEYARQLLETHLPALSPAAEATRALLRLWREQDADDDQERAEAELAELKAALNETRRQTGARPLFP